MGYKEYLSEQNRTSVNIHIHIMKTFYLLIF